MFVTLTIDSAATVQNHGSVALITGTAEDGRVVTFGAEPRELEAALQDIVENDEDVDVWVEEWQITRVA